MEIRFTVLQHDIRIGLPELDIIGFPLPAMPIVSTTILLSVLSQGLRLFDLWSLISSFFACLPIFIRKIDAI